MKRILLLTLATMFAAVAAACPGQVAGGGDDDDDATADADPSQPQIDAGPGNPGDPDAAPTTPPGPQAGDGVDFTDYPESRSSTGATWGGVLTDIAQHLPPEYGNQYWDTDLITAGHETTHGINSDLRNYHNTTGERANGFYVLEDRGVIVIEPDIRKSDVAAYVPASLRGFRFDLYITGQTAWDDTPLYVWDEWVAYTNGGEVGVDLVEAGLWTYGWRDGVNGQLEFTVYALAVGMAVRDLDPTYFAANTQFKEFLAWNARRAMDVYRQGMVMEDFAWDEQDAFYATFRTGPDAEAVRQFVRDTYGQEFLDELLAL